MLHSNVTATSQNEFRNIPPSPIRGDNLRSIAGFLLRSGCTTS